MYKTLIQTLLAGFYAILAASPLEGGGVMIAARHILFAKRLLYDTKIEYIESSGAAYFSLRDYLIRSIYDNILHI